MTASVSSQDAELLLHTSEVGQPESADISVVNRVAIKYRQIGRRLGGLRISPDYARCLDVHVW